MGSEMCIRDRDWVCRCIKLEHMPGDSDVTNARKQAKAAQRLVSDEEGDDGEAQQREQSSSESSDLSDSSDSSSESEEDTGEAAESADDDPKPRRLKKSAMVEDQAERSDDGGSHDGEDMDSEEEAEELERQRGFQVEEEVEEEPGAQAELDQAERAKAQEEEDGTGLDDQLQEELSRLGPRNTDHPASPKQPAPNRLYNMPGWKNLQQEVIDQATREQAEMVEQYGGTVASKARDSDTEEYSEEEEQEQLSSKEKRANALRDLRKKQARKQAGQASRPVQVEPSGQAQPIDLSAMYETKRRKRRLAAAMAHQSNQGVEDLDPDGTVDEGTPLTQALEEMCHCKGVCRPVDGLRIHSDSEECLPLKIICLWEHAASQCDGIRATLGKADNLPTAIPIGPFIPCMPAEQPMWSATKVASISQAQYHKQHAAQTPLDIQDTLGAGSFYIPGCIWAKADLLEGRHGRPGSMLDFWEGLALDAQQFLAKQAGSPDAASSPEWQVKIGNNTLSVNPDRRAGPVLSFASREDDFSRKNCRIYILQKMLFHLQNACDKLKQVTGNRCEFVFHAKA